MLSISTNLTKSFATITRGPVIMKHRIVVVSVIVLVAQ